MAAPGANSCCEIWKAKYTKLEEKRNALREAVNLLNQENLKIQAEIIDLKKNPEVENLKSRVSDAEAQINQLQELLETAEAEKKRIARDLEAAEAKAKSRDLVSEKVKLEEENQKLLVEKKRAELEAELRLELKKKFEEERQKLVRERTRVDSEKGKLEEQRKLAEDSKKQLEVLKKESGEARKRADLEAVEARKMLEELKKEAEAAKLGLDSERLRFQEANRKVEEERQKVVKERKRVDSEKMKSEKQRKLAEEYRVQVEVLKKETEEAKLGLKSEKLKFEGEKKKMDSELMKVKAKAEEYRVQLEEAKSEKLKFEEANKKLEEEKHKVVKKRKRENSETLRAEGQRMVAVEEKCRADGLAKELEVCRGKIEELEKKMNVSLLCGKFDKDMNEENAEVKLLRKQLKFEKIRAKHAKEVAKWEKSRNDVLRLELGRLKVDFVRISSRLEALDSCFSPSTEGVAFSGSKCLRLVEKDILDVPPTISGLFGESTEMRSNGNLALVTENSVRGSVGIDAVGTVKGHSRKRKRQLDAVESVECLYSKGKKLNMQIEEKLAALQGMSKYSETKLCENENVCQHASQLNTNLIGTAQVCREDISDSLTSHQETIVCFEDIANGDFMKLLDLDNAVDEECYRVAMEMPLSPTVPEIEFRGNETVELEDDSRALADGSFHAGLTNGTEILVPSSSVSAINMEINCNKLTVGEFGTSGNSLVHKNQGPADSLDKMGNKGDDNCDAMQLLKGCVDHSGVEAEKSNVPVFGNEGAHGDMPLCLIVFSDIKDSNSISRIFCAIRACVARCSLVSQTDWVAQKILLALKMEQKVSLKEKACVFFSLLLLNFSAATSRKYGNFSNWNSVSCLDSFAGHIRAVMSDVETRSLFAELYCMDNLLSLVEDFLLDGRVMVCNDVAFEPLIETASVSQLLAGSIILAAICATIDHIGFICETSYNIFRIHRCDSDLVLTILHVFAYLGGEKYFTLTDYSLIMIVLKSIVTFHERAGLSEDAAACFPSVTKVQAEFPPCSKCPFSQNAVSVDIVTSLLLEKLQNYALSGTMHPLNSKVLSDKSKSEQSLSDNSAYVVLNTISDASYCLNKCEMPAIQSNPALSMAFCHLTDVLSLLELVAYNMSWSWTCVNVVPKLLRMLESCFMETFTSSLVILLGQLGRLGVDVGGYENEGVDGLRRKLSDFLCQSTTMKAGLSIQIATVTALLGVLSLDFEELTQTTMKLPAIASQAVSANLIRKWFSSLSKEQQVLSLSILQSAGVNKKLRSFT